MRRAFVAFGVAAGVYSLLTVALTWPLLLHAGSRVPNDLGDPLLNMFLLAWNAREVPLTERWWNLPQFFPIAGAMAFSEHLLGLSLFATPVIMLTGNVLLGYNVVFLLSFPLSALAAHLLVYQLTRRHDVAFVAGLAYAFAPYRMAQFPHVQVLSGYWMPLALLGLHKYLDDRRWRWLALFAGSWYLQSLACGYYLFYLSVLLGLWLLWFAVGRMRWLDFAKIIVAWGVAAIAYAPIAWGYMQYQRAYGLRRWPDEIESFSADVASLLSASGNLYVWGWLNVFDRPESNLFPGAALIVVLAAGVIMAWSAAAHETVRRLRAARILLALAAVFALVAASPWWFGAWKLEVAGIRLLSVGTPRKPFSVALLLAIVALAMHPSIRAGWRRRSALAFYTIAAVVMWIFSLGPSPTLMGKPLVYKAPYAWLMLVPGVEGVRVPARFWVLASMCLAVAGALAVRHVVARWPRARPAFVAVFCALLLIEAWPEPIRLPAPPAARPALTRAVARLDLPLGPVPDVKALYRAIEHERPLFNGYSGYFAPHYGALQDLVRRQNGEVLTHLASFGAIEIQIDHSEDPRGVWRGYIATHPNVETVLQDAEHSVYRIPRNTTKIAARTFSGKPLPVSSVAASVQQDRVAHMLDGDLISRWDTGGPQDASNEVTIDLGAVRQLDGIELQIGGYLADFPRMLVVELSSDGAQWSPAWSGETALLAFAAALDAPLTVPLRIPLEARSGRHLRLRQTSEDDVYYWSIAELIVYGW